MRDKRKFHRWKVSLPCSYQGENWKMEGRIVDLSYGGACIREAAEVPVEGEELTVGMHLKEDFISVHGRVVFEHPEYGDGSNDFGVEFYGSLAERGEKLVPLFKHYLEQEE